MLTSLRRVLLLSVAIVLLAAGAIVVPAPAAAQPIDVTPPSFNEGEVIDSPDDLDHFTFNIIDTESGLASITIGMVENLTMTVAPYTPGTTSPVAAMFSRIDPSLPIAFAIAARDVAGNDIVFYVWIHFIDDSISVDVQVDSVENFLGKVVGRIDAIPINGPASTSASVRRALLTTAQFAQTLHSNDQNQLACLQLSSLELQIRAQIAKRRISTRDIDSLGEAISLSRIGLGCSGTTTH